MADSNPGRSRLSGSLWRPRRVAVSSTRPISRAAGPEAHDYSVDRIEVGALRVAYRRVGQGPPVILLHGFVGDSREWRPEIEALSDEFTVVAWDAPGAGQSADPPETFRLADYADCLAAFVDALGVRRPHVVGLSFGGALALELYRRHPELPLSLVLASAYAGWTGSLPSETVEQRLGQTLRAADLPPNELVDSM